MTSQGLPSYLEQQAYQYRYEKARRKTSRTSDYYAEHLHILDKQARLVPYAPNKVQQDFLNSRTGRDLILKARQQGISTAVQADYFLAAITSTAQVATLAHDDPTTQKLRRMAKRFYDGLPDADKPPRGLDNATTTTYPQTGSEVTIATAGSLNTGRGGTYSHVHGSEVAFWKDAEGLMAGILQGVPTGGGLIALESTPNGAQGWFYERCMEALDGDSTWTLHFYPWWHDAGYTLTVDEPLRLSDDEAALVKLHKLTDGQIAWRRAKQKELGRLFAQEYPEDARSCFLLSGESYFGALEGVFTAPFDATPQAGHRYVAGLDFGQANDWTVLRIGDATTLQEVAMLRVNKLPWAEIRRQIIATCQQWGVQQLWAESNSIGAPNIEALLAAGLPVVAFATTAQTKPPLIAGYSAALNEHGLKLLDEPVVRREHQAFAARQTSTGAWTYAATPPEHDDTVIAGALMAHGMMAGGPLILFEM